LAQISLDPAFTSSGTAQLVVSGYNCLPTSFNITVVQGLTINLKAMLQGPFVTTEMNPALNNSGLLPLSQPFNTSPWNYSGIESVSTIPNSNVVDWVLVELRDAPSAAAATSATRIARQAAFILKNGYIVGLDGTSYLIFDNLINQQLFVVIWHRNHLSVLSANALTSNAETYSYDFSTPAGKAFGVNSQNQLAANSWGMISGDSNGSGLVGTDDLNPSWNTNGGKSGFSTLDLNLDTQLNNVDKDSFWWPNIGKGTNVPQ
jgi:hypothetical protein